MAAAERVKPSATMVWVPERSATNAPSASTWPIAPGATMPSAGVPRVANWIGYSGTGLPLASFASAVKKTTSPVRTGPLSLAESVISATGFAVTVISTSLEASSAITVSVVAPSPVSVRTPRALTSATDASAAEKETSTSLRFAPEMSSTSVASAISVPV